MAPLLAFRYKRIRTILRTVVALSAQWIVLKRHHQNRFTFNFVEYFGDLAAVILRFLHLLKMASAQFSLHYTAEEVVDMLDVSD